jgi:hypothetical protein
MTSHETQAIFLFTEEPHHRNSICIFLITTNTPLGALNIEKKYRNKLVKIELIRTTFPPNEINFLFQPPNLFLKA